MCRVFAGVLWTLAGLLSSSTVALARTPNPGDYPLRVHILKNVVRPNADNAYAARNPENMADYINGQGAADLFENGQPQGFMYTYSCIEPLRASEGYASYPARWKKKDKTLEILVPRAGKPWLMETCDLQVAMRPGLAYFWNDDDGSVKEEPAADFKAWMVKHRYDPERDMDLPTDAAPAPAAAGETGSSSSQHTGAR